MKKSYDYFKTLKILSDAVFSIYLKILKNQDFSSDRIQFFAEKSELINNLQNEFITPLERGDIFLLAECLTDEIYSVFSLQEYMNLIDRKEYQDFNTILKSLEEQKIILSRICNFKSNIKLFEQCSEEIKKLNADKKEIEKHIVQALKCQAEQPLIAYAVYSALLDLNKKIYKTILQSERILIDNS